MIGSKWKECPQCNADLANRPTCGMCFGVGAVMVAGDEITIPIQQGDAHLRKPDYEEQIVDKLGRIEKQLQRIADGLQAWQEFYRSNVK